ncbi:MAG: RidA family protein [Verrucomicrobiota bacterium]
MLATQKCQIPAETVARLKSNFSQNSTVRIPTSDAVGSTSRSPIEEQGNSRPATTIKPSLASCLHSFEAGESRVCLGSLRPQSGTTLAAQLQDLHAQLDTFLAEHGFKPGDIVKENIFLSQRSAKAASRRFIKAYHVGQMPTTSFIIQPPANGAHIAMEVLAIKGDKVQVERVSENLTVVRDSNCRWAYVGGVEPAKGITDTYAQALSCFTRMHHHLQKAGFHFNQVVRTWIYVRDIVACDQDDLSNEHKQRYQILNDARRQFFTTGNEGRPFTFPYNLPPASTGIGMTEGNYVMECLALDMPQTAIEINPLNNPEQIDAHAYSQEVLERGAAAIKAAPLFSRGMSIRMDYKMLLISGTASIKGQETICLDDPEGQTRTTLENIDLVLGQAQATLRDVQQMRVYIKNSSRAAELSQRIEVIRRVVLATMPNIPILFVVADVCRDNLLVEIEALSFLKARVGKTKTGQSATKSALKRVVSSRTTGRRTMPRRK